MQDYHPDPRSYSIDELIRHGYVMRLCAAEYKPEFGNPYDWVNKMGYNALTGFDIQGWARNFVAVFHDKVDKNDQPVRALMRLAMKELKGHGGHPDLIFKSLEEEYDKIVPRWYEHG